MKALQGQTLIDLTLQSSGSADAAILAAIANDVSLTADLDVGSELDDINVQNATIATYYENKSLKPATALTDVENNVSNEQGLEFWIIETDFVIS